MSETKDEKAQKIRDQVERAADHRVLPRMRLHGYWPKGEGAPEDPPDERAERAAIEADKARLVQQAFTSPVDLKAALDAERARRIAESRQRRTERLAARAENAKQRRQAWASERARRMVHAGVSVSAQLEDVVSDEARLLSLGLPILHTDLDVARALDIDLRRLRWLTFHRRAATLVHYHRFHLPKKSGGLRHISAPKPALKRAQRWVFEEVLARAASPSRLHPAAHGFVTSRNVVSNAQPHVGKAVVVNLDLKDFFPSITFGRVRGLFRGLGYSGAVATILALLCTEPPRVGVDVDGKRVLIAMGARQLPQGACTSPALTNLLCRRLDARLHGIGGSLGFSYTRYADDLTFSSKTSTDVATLLFRVRRVVVDEGLTENGDKTRVMRRGRRQEVTGVIVNDKAGVAREDVRRLRAILHQAARDGLAAQRRPGDDGVLPSLSSFVAELRGRIAWVQMVDRAKGDRLRQSLDAITTDAI